MCFIFPLTDDTLVIYTVYTTMRGSASCRGGRPNGAHLAKKNRWLMLVHQIPRAPSYLRVKIWRRLQRLGALPIKNSVYAMPIGEQAFEDLAWVAREIEQGGGEASICEVS